MAGTDEGLLLLSEGVEKAGLADVWATNEGKSEIFWIFVSRWSWSEELFDGIFKIFDSLASRSGDAESLARFNAKRAEFGSFERFAEVGFVKDEKNWFS